MKLSVQVDYLNQNKFGVWVYRRLVPSKLRLAVGKREINQSLKTKDQSIALGRYPAAHQAAEDILAKAGAVPRDLLIYELTLNDLKAAGLIGSNADRMEPIPDDYDARRNDFTEAVLADAEKLPLAIQNGPLRLDNNPALRMLMAQIHGVAPPKHRLSEAAEHYLKMKSTKFNSDSIRKDVNWAQRRVQSATGQTDPALDEITLDVAEKVRDAMLVDGNAASSVRRRLNTIKAMLNLFIKAKRLQREIDNPFNGLDIPDPTGALARDLRDALTVREIETCTAQFKTSNQDLQDIWTLQVFTGARPSEIRAMPWVDVNLTHEIPHVVLRYSDNRRVKTDTSIRSVPLVGSALQVMKDREAERKDEDEWVFSRYAKVGGMNALSNAQIKGMKAAGVWVKTKKVPYSVRHSMTDWMRRSAGQEWEDRLMGHASTSQGKTYGSDEMLDLLAQHMTTALINAGVWK